MSDERAGDRRQPPGAAERSELGGELPGGGGLCPGCLHLRLARSARSAFVRCALADSDPAYPRYPVLPVIACKGFEPWRRG